MTEKYRATCRACATPLNRDTGESQYTETHKGWAEETVRAEFLASSITQLRADLARVTSELEQAKLALQQKRRDGFLSRAPAQAAEPGPDYACADMQGPVVTDRQAAVMWMHRAESAESKLAATREIVFRYGTRRFEHESEWSRTDCYDAIRTLLAPSQGEGGVGK